jgi:membrane-bound lytic murein transglycosylase A
VTPGLRGAVSRLSTFLLPLLVLSCAPHPPVPPHLTVTPARFADLGGWQRDGVAEAVPAFLKSCAALAKLADDTPLKPPGVAGMAGDWRRPCADAAALAPATDDTARRFFEAEFTPYALGDDGEPEGLFTGYFEPELRGARHRGGVYQTPLLRRPADLVMVDLGLFRPDWHGERIAGRVVDGRLTPFPDRAAIEDGALDAERLALLWVDDPVAAFFLQIQGSGRVRLPDGSMVLVGYDGQNGQAYVPIGRLLVERGALTRDEVSLETITAWLARHPGEAKALMERNPSYVFFREIKANGALGTEGVVLTPGRSLAVDADFIPLGAPLWLDAEQENDRVRRLVVAQDTGGAIRGPVRGDVFWGFGAAAEAHAGGMRARGVYYVLLPRSVMPLAAGRPGG